MRKYPVDDRVKATVFIISMSLLAGCMSMISVSDNEACLVKISVPTSLANCAGIYDVVYKYRNPSRPNDTLQFYTLYNQNVLQNYRRQEGSNHCYAATLASSFAILGVKYSQAQFAKAFSQQCFATSDAPLTFSQIVFAATRVHAPPGVWYIDFPNDTVATQMNKIADIIANKAVSTVVPTQSAHTVIPIEQVGRCQAASSEASSQYWIRFYVDPESLIKRAFSNQQESLAPTPDINPPAEFEQISNMNLYKPITWRFNDQPLGTVNGAIVPIRDSGHLIDVFSDGVPVIAGLIDGFNGHVVLLERIRFAAIYIGSKKVERHDSGYIDWVQVVDPGNPDLALRIIPGDEFLSSARFIFAIYQGTRK